MLHNLPAQHARRGATLVEVLMALLVMAIGVTSVFTLFPLAMLKSVKASQLTNAKLYEGSIEDMVLGTPQLVTGAPTWEARTIYINHGSAGVIPFPSRWVTPSSQGRLLPESNLLFFGTSGTANPRSGFLEPSFPVSPVWRPHDDDYIANRNLGGYRNNWPRPVAAYANVVPGNTADGPITWQAYRHSPLPGNWTWSAYIVDPLGFHSPSTDPTDQPVFGRIPSLSLPVGNPGNYLALDRIHCHLSSSSADGFFKLPDSYTVTLESTNALATYPVANQINLTFPDLNPDLISANSLTGSHRVVLSSTLVGTTLSVPVTIQGGLPNNPTAQELRLRIDPATIPAGFLPLVDQARIEVQSPSRYSWLMAVRLGPEGELEAQAAVVFNRTFEIEDEQGYEAEFCTSEDTNLNNTLDANEDDMWPNGRLDTNLAKIRWLYNPLEPGAGPKVKEGSYILDASHAAWYQISKIIKFNDLERVRVNANDTINPNGPYVRMVMQLDAPVKDGGVLYPEAPPAPPPPPPVRNTDFTDYRLFDGEGFAGSAVLIPGVVHVFPIRP